MKLTSVQNISPRSRFSAANSLPCQNYLLVRTILHGVVLFMMIGWPNLLCRLSMIPPCQLGIQKLHIHWKYPSGFGFIHTRSDTSRPLRHRQRSYRPSIRRCLSWRRHQVTWITWPPLWRSPHSPNSEIFIAPAQYIFHSDGERR